ncbi:MAG: hypothetical protein OHK0011_08340 [Turneriella sp.]
MLLTGSLIADAREANCRPGVLIPKPEFQLKVQTSHRETAGGFALLAKNNEPIAVYLDVTMVQLVNLRSEHGKRFVLRIEANSTQTLNTLTIINPAKASNFNYKADFRFTENVTASPDREFVYELPLAAGVESEIIQGYRGKFSHSDAENQHALDFALPRGTAIHAARAGMVLASRSDYTSGGIDARLLNSIDSAGNFVMMLHEDGTVAHYAHLQCGGTNLRRGDRVETGDLIGYSGSTGYSHPDYPHLHFVVRLPEKNSPYGKKTIPTRFRVNGEAVELKEAGRYSR